MHEPGRRGGKSLGNPILEGKGSGGEEAPAPYFLKRLPIYFFGEGGKKSDIVSSKKKDGSSFRGREKGGPYLHAEKEGHIAAGPKGGQEGRLRDGPKNGKGDTTISSPFSGYEEGERGREMGPGGGGPFPPTRFGEGPNISSETGAGKSETCQRKKK